LNTSKTRFGFPQEAQFFGFVVDHFGARLADKHLCPLRSMVPPEDISELRRVLGLFVVSRKYLKDYAVITKPLTVLLRGKQPVFKWEEPQQRAYEHIRDALLSGLHLPPPDGCLGRWKGGEFLSVTELSDRRAVPLLQGETLPG
jgi:hypothetical protein